jgi:2-polyprenyl-3-methyl-5-hydroxy-6-metoxy-1,4-benzoquinol methylase
VATTAEVQKARQYARRMSFAPLDHYDPRTGGHDGIRESIEPREVVALELARPLVSQSAGALLDIGCGDGLFLSACDRELHLSERGWRLSGIDYSETQIAHARRRPYEFAQCNVENGLPFADSSYDLIFCGELIEHLYNPDAFVEECYRVIAPGGYLIITTPNLQAWYNRILFVVGVQPLFYETSTRSTHIGAGILRRLKRGSTPVGHVRVFNKRALRDLLHSQGFQPVTVRGAIFSYFPGPLRLLDRIFNGVPSLASNLIFLSAKVERPAPGVKGPSPLGRG